MKLSWFFCLVVKILEFLLVGFENEVGDSRLIMMMPGKESNKNEEVTTDGVKERPGFESRLKSRKKQQQKYEIT